MMQQTNDRFSRDGADTATAPNPMRTIFRAQARRFTEEEETSIELPRLASPRLFPVFWLLAVLLTVVGSLVAFWPLISSWSL